MIPEDTPLFEVEQLGKQFDGICALEGYNLALKESELMDLIGPNGAGKDATLPGQVRSWQKTRKTGCGANDLRKVKHYG